MPDLLGWDAEKGIEKLSSLGLQWEAEVTKPPNSKISGGQYKIIKQIKSGNIWCLTLSMVPDNFR